MIQRRREREVQARTARNQRLQRFVDTQINPRFRLASLDAFQLRRSALGTPWDAVAADAALDASLLAGVVVGLGLKQPLPMQATAIPALLQRPFSLLAAQTGSGKTLAYLLPLFQRVKAQEQVGSARGCVGDGADSTEDGISSVTVARAGTGTGIDTIPTTHSSTSTPSSSRTSTSTPTHSLTPTPSAIVLVPTHELVLQVFRTAKALSHHCRLRIAWDLRALHRRGSPADIVVTTPGRLQDALATGELRTSALRHVVVDEADTLLGAEPGDAMHVLLAQPLLAQLRSFTAVSATVPSRLHRSLARLFPTQLHVVTLQGLHAPAPAVRQRFIRIAEPGAAKAQRCLQLLVDDPGARVLVFCRSVARATQLHRYLCTALAGSGAPGVPVNTAHVHSQSQPTPPPSVLPGLFHGTLPPVQRDAVWSKFARGHIRTLIATDLAARGLDTPWVSHVINYDFPRSSLDYLHRIGRTARAGRGGRATSFVAARDRDLAAFIQLAARQRRPLCAKL